MAFNINAQPHNADWTKHNWRLSSYKSEEFMDYLERTDMTLEEFRQLPIYKFAVEKGKNVDDERVGKKKLNNN